MNTYESDLIGLCWIPNLSGKVTTRDYLNVYFDSFPNESKYSFQWDSCSFSLIVTDEYDPRIKIKIVIMDEKGLCYIYNMSGVKFKLDYESPNDSELSYCVKEIWIEIRSMIDSCFQLSKKDNTMLKGAKTYCVCNAMDWPIPFDYEHIGNRSQLILDKFVKVAEEQSDRARHVDFLTKNDIFGNELPESIKNRMDADNKSIATQSINTIYMDRFISLYSNEIIDVDHYRSESVLRTRKLETISKFNNDSAQIDNLCLSSNSIRITRWGLIVASVAMGLNILSLVLTNI